MKRIVLFPFVVIGAICGVVWAIVALSVTCLHSASARRSVSDGELHDAYRRAREQLNDALRAIDSAIEACQKAQARGLSADEISARAKPTIELGDDVIRSANDLLVSDDLTDQQVVQLLGEIGQRVRNALDALRDVIRDAAEG